MLYSGSSLYFNSHLNYGDFLLHSLSPAQIWVSCSTHTFVRLEGLQYDGDKLAYMGTVYTHGSKLETASPRFSEPGDFLTYVLFVCAIILVGAIFLCFQFLSLFIQPPPRIICPCSALLPTITVPGNEEDYPCISAGPSFAINLKGSVAV